MLSRRGFLTRGVAAAAGLVSGAPLSRGDVPDRLPEGNVIKGMITPAAQQAIDNGLAYLARWQAVDGSFGTGLYLGNVAVTSLAGLALMAGGHQPGRGRHGKAVTSALEYLLNQDTGDGFLHKALGNEHGPMYSHGFGA